jgi:predicted alpha/beta superfamily hydrolase
MRRLHLLCAALLWLFTTTATFAEEPKPSPYVVADVFVIHSKILNEDRRLVIYNPDSVGGNVLPAYPVLYLLEENDMAMVAGVVKYMSSYNEQLPAMLVVGIDGNGQRIRDLTPTHSLYDNMGQFDPDPNSWLQPSGGGEKFLRFVREEVMPFVESKYRTAPFRILAGHSVGGLSAIEALTGHPDMFNAYLAVSPSLWWDNGTYLRSVAGNLPPTGATKKFLFVADSPESGPFATYMKALLDTLDGRKTTNFEWAHTFYPNETHGSIAAKAYYDGLRFLYPQWNAPEENRSAASIRSHYAAISRRLGYDVQPPFGLVSDWTDEFLRKGRAADALAMAQLNVRNFPKNAWAYGSLGDVYLRNGNRVESVAAYRKAVDIAPTDEQLKAKLAAATK